MAEFLHDPELTQERLGELDASVEWAIYELSAAVSLARALGMSWQQIGDALGMTRQGAQQRFSRCAIDVLSLEDDERRRLGRLLGVRDRVIRWEVQVIVSGRRGVSRVETQTLSRHLRKDVAMERAKRRPGTEVVRVSPDGERRVVWTNPER